MKDYYGLRFRWRNCNIYINRIFFKFGSSSFVCFSVFFSFFRINNCYFCYSFSASWSLISSFSCFFFYYKLSNYPLYCTFHPRNHLSRVFIFLLTFFSFLWYFILGIVYKFKLFKESVCSLFTNVTVFLQNVFFSPLFHYYGCFSNGGVPRLFKTRTNS